MAYITIVLSDREDGGLDIWTHGVDEDNARMLAESGQQGYQATTIALTSINYSNDVNEAIGKGHAFDPIIALEARRRKFEMEQDAKLKRPAPPRVDANGKKLSDAEIARIDNDAYEAVVKHRIDMLIQAANHGFMLDGTDLEIKVIEVGDIRDDSGEYGVVYEAQDKSIGVTMDDVRAAFAPGGNGFDGVSPENVVILKRIMEIREKMDTMSGISTEERNEIAALVSGGDACTCAGCVERRSLIQDDGVISDMPFAGMLSKIIVAA